MGDRCLMRQEDRTVRDWEVRHGDLGVFQGAVIT
jgi:hypothetical protein